MIKPVYDPFNDPVEVAKKSHQIIITPRANELQLDLDSSEAVTRFKESLDQLMQLGIKCSYSMTPSKTVGHFHATVSLDFNVASDMERIALQAILGSDPRRELYGWIRARAGKELVSLFFEAAKK